jgi:hypothetical protein
LHHLGVFTGDKSNPPVFEDVLLSEAFESNDLEKAKMVVERYSESHDVWAWKRPAALNYLAKVEAVIPNHFYIFIFKDIFAIANRNNISMKADVSNGLRNALRDYGSIVDFISSTDKPVMLVSAEKANLYKEEFVDTLIKINEEIYDLSLNRHQAIEFITPSPKDYLDSTRITKSIGVVDKLNSELISGWACLVHSNEAANVQIYINGNLALTVSADRFRKDLCDSERHRNGKCGFVIKPSDYNVTLKGDIMVKVENDVTCLKNGRVTL